MTLKRGAIYAAIITSLTVCWYVLSRRDRAVNTQIKSVSLTAEDAAKVIVDPAHHSITTVTRDAAGNTKTTATFLPSSGASVELRKNGSVVVTAPKWGTEINPFLGLAFGSDVMGRAALGVNLFYVQRWEIGGGLLLNTHINDTRAFAHVGYNVYGNIFVSGAIDNRRTAHVITSLKF